MKYQKMILFVDKCIIQTLLGAIAHSLWTLFMSGPDGISGQGCSYN